MLNLSNINAGYGQSQVLHNVSLSVANGESLAILGRNGAGKTTLINTIMGLTNLHSGHIRLKNQAINHIPPYKRAHMGLGWVPQERAIFPGLTTEENLTVVARPGTWDLSSIFKLFPILKQRRHNYGDQLSGGEQQMLAIARALITNPCALLLDEPLEGLAPIVASTVLSTIETLLRNASMAIIMVEQQPRQVLSITNHAIVLDRGKIVYSGNSKKLLADTAAQQKWLGAGSI